MSYIPQCITVKAEIEQKFNIYLMSYLRSSTLETAVRLPQQLHSILISPGRLDDAQVRLAVVHRDATADSAFYRRA